MPNHIQCELVAAAEVIDALGDPVDFNRIIPCPEIISHEDALCGLDEIAIKLYAYTGKGDLDSFLASLRDPSQVNSINWAEDPVDKFGNRAAPSYYPLLAQYIEAYRETGYCNWYDWNVANWGTKWNAYESQITKTDLECKARFETPWNAPMPVIEKLSQMFPGHSILFGWADEDFSYNVGAAIYLNGRVILGGQKENGSKAAKEMALDLIYGGEIPEHMYRDENGEIQYKYDCDEDDDDITNEEEEDK